MRTLDSIPLVVALLWSCGCGKKNAIQADPPAPDPAPPASVASNAPEPPQTFARQATNANFTVEGALSPSDVEVGGPIVAAPRRSRSAGRRRIPTGAGRPPADEQAAAGGFGGTEPAGTD